MVRETFTRRRWLAAVGAGLTAGCGGRTDGEATADPTATPTSTPRSTVAASSRTATTTAEPDPEPAVSFHQGPGECHLETEPVADGTWPMAHRDPAGTNVAPAVNGPQTFPLNERWTVSALKGQLTLPVADDRFLYLVAADGDTAESVPTAAVLCHDTERNGEIQWRYRIDAMPLDTPVIAGEAIYVPFGTPEDTRIIGFDRSNGEEVMSAALPGRYAGGMATAGTGLVVPTESAYRVFDLRSGDHCWSFVPNDVERSNRDDRQIRAAAVEKGVAYVGTGYPDGDSTTEVGHLYAVDPSIEDMRWHVATDGPVGRIAVVDGLVIAATADAVVGLDPESGEQLWRHAADERVRPSALAVTDDLVVYGTRRTLHGLDRTDGTEQWSLVFGVRGAAIVVGDTLYGVGRFDPTTARIMLSAVDVTMGRRRWRQQIYDPLIDVMAAQGYLFATTTDGRLFAFTHL